MKLERNTKMKVVRLLVITDFTPANIHLMFLITTHQLKAFLQKLNKAEKSAKKDVTQR